MFIGKYMNDFELILTKTDLEGLSEDVIAAADEHGMSMLFTGVRLFRH